MSQAEDPVSPESSRLLPSRHIRRSVSLGGYVIDDEKISRIDERAAALVSNTSGDDVAPLEVEYRCAFAKSDVLRFSDVGELLAYGRDRQASFTSIRSTHQRDGVGGFSVAYESTGEISVSAYGTTPELEFNVESIMDEVGATTANFPWWVRRILLPPQPERFLKLTLGVSSLALLLLSGYYLYGTRFGINIDQSVAANVPQGLQYKAAVAEALKSSDSQKKLDVLLYGELQDFTTLDQWLIDTQRQLAFLLFIVVITAIVVLLFRRLKSLYPRAFFAIGRNAQQLTVMQRKRDFWEGAVLVAFAVNLITGLLLAFFT